MKYLGLNKKYLGLNRWLVLLLAGLLSACARGPVESPRHHEMGGTGGLQGPVVEQRWNLLLVGTDERLSMPETPWFRISQDGRVSGSDGCQPLQGRVSLGDSQRIEFSGLGAAPRGCAQAADAQRVRAMMDTAYRYLIDHDRLVFFGPDQRVLGGWRKAG